MAYNYDWEKSTWEVFRGVVPFPDPLRNPGRYPKLRKWDLKLLRELQVLDPIPMVFGSSIKGGRFCRYRGRAKDLDLVFVVSLDQWVEWATEVYGRPASVAVEHEIQRACSAGCCISWGEAVGAYEYSSPTRSRRRAAAAATLGITLPGTNTDVFLFPEEFVHGSMIIEPWTEFRRQVLATWRDPHSLRIGWW